MVGGLFGKWKKLWYSVWLLGSFCNVLGLNSWFICVLNEVVNRLLMLWL